jgi:serine phosphatase RsbU (regulator of sigma subunit)
MRPAEVCAAVNRVMCENMSEGFITFFYAVLESDPKRLTYCNAGHCPPIFVMQDEISGHGLLPPGEGGPSRNAAPDRDFAFRLTSGGAVLGVFPDWQYDESQVDLHSGDRLLLYTDGITESRKPTDEEFGDDRLIDLILQSSRLDASALADRAVAAATEFTNANFHDDLTVVAISVD